MGKGKTAEKIIVILLLLVLGFAGGTARLRPGAAAALMGIVVWLMQHFLPMHRLLTILEIAVGVAVYIAAAFLLKVLSVSDIRSMLRRRRKPQ